MKKIFYYSVLIISGLTSFYSCNKDNSGAEQANEQKLLNAYLMANRGMYDSTVNKLYYIEKVKGTGPAVRYGDYVLVNYTGRLLADTNIIVDVTDTTLASASKIYSISAFNGPVMLWTDDSSLLFSSGFRQGLTLMNEGGKIRLIIQSKLGLGSYSTAVIPAYSTLIYDIEVVKVIKDPVAYDKEQVLDTLVKWGEGLADSISGIYIKFDKPGVGESVEQYAGSGSGYTLRFYYSANLLNGNYIAGSRTDTIQLSAVLGSTALPFVGFLKMLDNMRLGSSARVIIPYYYAYGSKILYNSYNQILVPYYSSLYFKITMTNIN
jgi:FKBP-type peptidyl-prolyl cis-trans isomerase